MKKKVHIIQIYKHKKVRLFLFGMLADYVSAFLFSSTFFLKIIKTFGNTLNNHS